MITKIKILLLKDSSGDADYIKNILLEEGFDVDIVLTQNTYEFEMVINSEKNFNLILVDCSGKSSDSFAILRIAQESLPDIPFILISAELGEDYAIEAMKMGVTDYVLKHRIQRLAPSIRRALRDYEEKIELKKAQEHFQLLDRAIEASNNGIFITNKQQINSPIIFVNKAFERITGYSKDEVIGRNPAFLYKSDNSQKEIGIILDAIENGKDSSVRFMNCKKDGELFWNELRLSPLRNQNNLVTHYIGIINDVTETVKKENEIIKLSRAVKQSSASIIITNKTGIIEFVNSEFENITGFKSEEVIGKHPLLLNDKFSKNIYDLLKRSMFEKTELENEFNEYKKNGQDYWLFVKVTPLTNNSDEIINYLITIEDITLRKKAEQEIIAAKEEAEEMNKLKTAILSNISHELRTPLVAILGFARILYDELVSPELKDMAEIILNSGNNLTQTLNQILDLSKIESESVSLNFRTINVEKILRKVFVQNENAAAKKELYLTTKISKQLFIEADEQIFANILNNLVDNAIKYTESGGVTVTLESIRRDETEYALIKVEDTGIGIPESNFSLIFESFRQGSEGINRKYQGLGVGLTITKKYIDLINGEIKVESSPGKGSVFSVFIPLSTKEKESEEIFVDNYYAEQTEEDNNNVYKILVVEDDKTNRELIKIFLKDFYDVTEVSSGEEAVETAKEKTFDVILMDIGLKGMDGVETVKLIRKIPGYENISITAVTAFAMAGDKERFLSSGFTWYLPKPFIKKTMLEHLQMIIQKSMDKKNNFESLEGISI